VYFTGVFVGLARRRPLPGFFPIMVGPEHVRTRSGYRERERGAETMSEIGTANSITIHATAEKIWAAITRPETIKQWFFGVETETDWQVGSPIVHRGEWQGKPCEDKGEIVRFDPPKVLVHTHWSDTSGRPDRPENYQEVSWELTERDEDTDLTVTEHNLPSGEARAVSDRSWAMALQKLKELVEA
jgi:uncharacterized protein YndB with AHSA1/START domain